MRILHGITAIVWFPLCIIGLGISLLGGGIWYIGAFIHDLTMEK